jgi:hypothetical protein
MDPHVAYNRALLSPATTLDSAGSPSVMYGVTVATITLAAN